MNGEDVEGNVGRRLLASHPDRRRRRGHHPVLQMIEAETAVHPHHSLAVYLGRHAQIGDGLGGTAVMDMSTTILF